MAPKIFEGAVRDNHGTVIPLRRTTPTAPSAAPAEDYPPELKEAMWTEAERRLREQGSSMDVVARR